MNLWILYKYNESGSPHLAKNMSHTLHSLDSQKL